ncbi:transglycosylase domain-containing protein [Bacillus pacificus]
MEKTSKRKVQEIYLAYKLEQQYSKHEILEMYLNKINLETVHMVSQQQHKTTMVKVERFNITELRCLQVFKAPNNYDPTKTENIQRATERRNVVLGLMNRHGYITETEMEETSKLK